MVSAEKSSKKTQVLHLFRVRKFHRYGFVYDGLNRLTAGLYQNPENPTSGENSEIIESYDTNGNILALKRFSKIKITSARKIDDLTYTYDGNRAIQINDNGDSSGYPGGGGTMQYDDNGNITEMPDRGMTIEYNFLNLPSEVNSGNPVYKYYYRADGTKYKKTNTLVGIASTTAATTEYIDGFQYITESKPFDDIMALRTEPVINIKTATREEVFESSLEAKPLPPNTSVLVLSFFPTAEGFYDYQKNMYIYQYKDHLGNIRVSYAKNSEGVLTILDRNDYYPFGMNFVVSQKPKFAPKSGWENYKYNGKELQETGMYDYGARMYMSDIGRWGVVDPLAEKAPGWTPYRYGYNNPISFTDPTGMSEDWYETEGGDMVFDDNVKSQKDLTDRGIQGTYKYESGQEGNLTYAADGYVYDDSTAGGGQPIENGRLNNIEEVSITKTSWWNSPLVRYLVPDRMGISQSGSIGGVLDIGTSMSLEVITRGKDAGIYFDPGNTISGGVSFGAGGTGSTSFFSSNFTGKVSNMSLNSVVGTEAYVNGSIAAVAGVTASVAVSFDPKNPFAGDRWVTRSTGVSFGAKASLGAGVTLSNTRMGVGFDGKARVADYTGVITGKGSY